MPPRWLDSLVCVCMVTAQSAGWGFVHFVHTHLTSTQVQETPTCFWHMGSLRAWMPVWNPARKQESSGRRSFLIPAPTHISLLNGRRGRHLEVSGARVSDALSCHFWGLAGGMSPLGEAVGWIPRAANKMVGLIGSSSEWRLPGALPGGVPILPDCHKPLTGPWRRRQSNRPAFSPRAGWRSNHHIVSLRDCTVALLPLFLYLFLSRALSVLWKQTNCNEVRSTQQEHVENLKTDQTTGLPFIHTGLEMSSLRNPLGTVIMTAIISLDLAEKQNHTLPVWLLKPHGRKQGREKGR